MITALQFGKLINCLPKPLIGKWLHCYLDTITTRGGGMHIPRLRKVDKIWFQASAQKYIWGLSPEPIVLVK